MRPKLFCVTKQEYSGLSAKTDLSTGITKIFEYYKENIGETDKV